MSSIVVPEMFRALRRSLAHQLLLSFSHVRGSGWSSRTEARRRRWPSPLHTSKNQCLFHLRSVTAHKLPLLESPMRNTLLRSRPSQRRVFDLARQSLSSTSANRMQCAPSRTRLLPQKSAVCLMESTSVVSVRCIQIGPHNDVVAPLPPHPSPPPPQLLNLTSQQQFTRRPRPCTNSSPSNRPSMHSQLPHTAQPTLLSCHFRRSP